MTMKKNIIISVAAVILAAMSTSCSVDETGIYGSFPYLEVEVESKTLTKTASTDAIALKTNRTVSVIVAADTKWLTAVAEGEQLVLSWTANDLETTREAVIHLSTPNSIVTREIRVTQDASGELTFDGNLILRSKEEIAANTYTKTTGDLVIGNVTSIVSKSTDNSVSVDINGKTVTASPSDISDEDMDLLEEQIHMIGGKGLAVVNTQVTELPLEIIAANGVEKLGFDYNAIEELPSAETMESLGLKELSLKGNDISDISALAGCTTIESLDLTGNDVYDLEPLMSMTGLQNVVLTDLPLTQAQVEVFREQTGLNVVADNVRQDASPLPVFGNVVITEVSDTEVIITAQVTNDASGVTKAGFYVGNERSLAGMTWHDAVYSDGTLTLTFHPETLTNKVWYVRAYAENAAGVNYSKVGVFGSLFYYEDVYLRNASDIQNLVENKYSHIEGSVLVGDMISAGEGVRLDDGRFSLYFAPSTFDDLSVLNQIAYVRDGLYIGNVGMSNTDYISHISGMTTLWLRGNKISSIPAMDSDATLTYLDVSMNSLNDFSFLDRMPLLEKLYLGSSDTPSAETNNIGLLTGLEKYTNLKYIDLGGLPIHEWQVSDLRVIMPETEIAFRSGGRDPWIPTVVSRGVSRYEGMVELKGSVSSIGASQITEYGFYFSKDNVNFEKLVAGSSVEAYETFTYEVTIPDEEMYYFYPYAVNVYGESRTKVQEFTLAYQDLSQNGTANCYIASGSGKYMFDASVKGCTIESVGAIASAEILWETKNTTDAVSVNEVIKSVSLSENKVIFEVPSPMVPGNAVIAVRDAAGTILWSWHIWVTDFEPNSTSQIYSGEYVMMDRNLGALNATRGDVLSFGLFYQQGRKDPFIGCGNISTYEFASTAPAGLISYSSGGSTWESIANPNIVYGYYDSMWTDEKNMYDPCPVGWKVPSEATWSGFSSDYLYAAEIGVLYVTPASTPDAYYPYTGDTEMGRQQLRFPGESGYVWTTKYGYAYCPAGNNLESRSIYDENPVRCCKEIGFSVTIGNVNAYSDGASVAGNVRANDQTVITERGFVYSSENSTPVLGDCQSVTCGAGTGDFSATISGLNPITTYYVRAYAVGDGVTKYSDTVTFMTLMSGDSEDFTEDGFDWE